MTTRDKSAGTQDSPAILEVYGAAKRRPCDWWKWQGFVLDLFAWVFFLAALLAAFLFLFFLEDPDGSNARNPELGTDPAGRHLPAIGQKDCGPTASRRPARAAEGAAILPAQPPVQNAVIVPSSGFRVSRLLDAIRQVESSNRPDPPDRDQGRSIGPYQIQRKYWIDAGVPWPYQAVRSERGGRATVLAYWRRRAPEALAAGDLQVLARIHNGGPKWAAKPATLDYWRRVRGALAAVRFNAEYAENAETKG
jgi:hypothetical protein